VVVVVGFTTVVVVVVGFTTVVVVVVVVGFTSVVVVVGEPVPLGRARVVVVVGRATEFVVVVVVLVAPTVASTGVGGAVVFDDRPTVVGAVATIWSDATSPAASAGPRVSQPVNKVNSTMMTIPRMPRTAWELIWSGVKSVPRFGPPGRFNCDRPYSW
ncbi:MAG: hypothetical protein ACR2NL_05285, partial [Acidimicrobiia bacterium]